MLKFEQFENPPIKFKRAIKKPIPIECVQINEPFEVETLEGTMTGKKGDWLMKGVNGELYPCDRNIFDKTYTIIE